ncbi:hypothetical protein [Streptomyces sp. NPDC001930]|uniref:hypothetical protein n=1 Tax=Streptomyces sp. NPDC001930 TaxID=3364625 RepID=UPI0036B7AA5F
MSEGPPGTRSEGSAGAERPRIRQAVALHGATASERSASGPVFVSQPAPAEPASRQAAGESAPTRAAGRSRRRSRSTAQARPELRAVTPPAPASPTTASPTAAERPDDGGSTPTGTAAAAPTAAPPRAAANGSSPPTRRATGGSGGQGGRPLMAAAAIAGAVLVSVPLVVSQGSDTEQATHAVGDVTASVPVALLGEQGGATWPSTQGGTDRQALEHSERIQQPSAVRPSTPAPGKPDQVDTSTYKPPVITPADEKSIDAAGSPGRKPPVGQAPPRAAIPPVRINDAGGGVKPDNTKAPDADTGTGTGTDRTPRKPTTVLAVSNTTTDRKPGPATQRTVRSDSGSRSDSSSRTSTRSAPTPPVRTAAPPVKTAAPPVKAAAPPVKTRAAAPARTRTPAPVRTPAAPAAPSVKEGQTKVLHGTYVIGRGQSVTTNRISLRMQQNGNLVILDSNGRARWSSGTAGSGDRAVFQGDGNFTVLAADGRTVWSSRTDGNPGAELVLQNDGNVTIQAADGRFLWGSGTQY